MAKDVPYRFTGRSPRPSRPGLVVGRETVEQATGHRLREAGLRRSRSDCRGPAARREVASPIWPPARADPPPPGSPAPPVLLASPSAPPVHRSPLWWSPCAARWPAARPCRRAADPDPPGSAPVAGPGTPASPSRPERPSIVAKLSTRRARGAEVKPRPVS